MSPDLITQENVCDLLKERYGLKEYSLRSAVRWLIANDVPNIGPSRKIPRYSRELILARLNFGIPKGYQAGSVLTVKAAVAARGKR